MLYGFKKLNLIMKDLIYKLQKKKLKISFAESCTGGMLAVAITSISGASKIFNLGLITYSPALTQNSASSQNVIRKASSPKPKLRPQSLDTGILIAVGYFTVKQNLERTLQTLELTGYPFSLFTFCNYTFCMTRRIIIYMLNRFINS